MSKKFGVEKYTGKILASIIWDISGIIWTKKKVNPGYDLQISFIFGIFLPAHNRSLTMNKILKQKFNFY